MVAPSCITFPERSRDTHSLQRTYQNELQPAQPPARETGHSAVESNGIRKTKGAVNELGFYGQPLLFLFSPPAATGACIATGRAVSSPFPPSIIRAATRSASISA